MKFKPFKMILDEDNFTSEEAQIAPAYVTFVQRQSGEIVSRHSIETADILKIADAIRMAVVEEK